MSILFCKLLWSGNRFGRDQASRKPVTTDFRFVINIQPTDLIKFDPVYIKLVSEHVRSDYDDSKHRFKIRRSREQ